MKRVIKWLWQFPQNMLALFIEGMLCLAAFRSGEEEGNTIIMNNVLPSAMSLGDYIFVNPMASNKCIKHECGHVKQSKMLGPLYLIIIGIPSILHCWYNDFVDCCWKDGRYHYEHFYTEKWAERLMEK